MKEGERGVEVNVILEMIFSHPIIFGFYSIYEFNIQQAGAELCQAWFKLGLAKPDLPS